MITEKKDNTMEISNEVRLVLVGKTGTGKSSIGNSILKQELFRRKLASPVSVTEKCMIGETFRNGGKLTIIDTPGLFHTSIAQNAVKREIAKCMNLLTCGPHAFLYVFRISRHSKEEEQTLDQLKDIFGDTFCKYCIVMFVTDTIIDENIDKFVKTLPYFYGNLVEECEKRVLKVCAVAENNEDMFVQISKFQQEIAAQQDPPFYSKELFSKSKSRLNKTLIQPAKNIFCWLKQNKKVQYILFVLIAVYGLNKVLYNSLTDVSPRDV